MPSFSPLARRSGMQRHTLMNTRTKLATDDLVTMKVRWPQSINT